MSLIKKIEDEYNEKYLKYVDSIENGTKIDFDINVEEELRNKKIKELVDSFNLEQTLAELEEYENIYNIHHLKRRYDGAFNTEIYEFIFKKFKNVTMDSFKYFSDEMYDDKELRNAIITKHQYGLIMLKNITYEESILAVKKSTYSLSYFKDVDKDHYNTLLWLHLHSNHNFMDIPDWKNVLTSEMITFIIANSHRDPLYDFKSLSLAKNISTSHTILTLKKNPLVVYDVLDVVSEKLDVVYFSGDKEDELIEAIKDIIVNYEKYFDVLLHPLFTTNIINGNILHKSYYQKYK